jgi:3' terminal RNA ribose 2'-O-methyltransferase Hen1
MLLTISTTTAPATDLGYLLHKHPDRVQSFSLNFGEARVFYPEANAQRCTAALLLDIDPIALVRGRPGGERGGEKEGGLLTNYVNDRPYAASSFLSVALSRVFASALGGRCEKHEELIGRALQLEAVVTPIRTRGGEAVVTRLFEPLGYDVEIRPAGEGAGRYSTVTLRINATLQSLLSHLYVLIPVLDDQKHYWVGEDEIDKLLRHGEGWLPGHPDRELIARRYLKHGRRLMRLALDRLAELEETAPEQAASDDAGPGDDEQAIVERPMRLNDQRIQIVTDALKRSGTSRVLDLGCGGGNLLRALLKEPQFEEIVGIDVSARELEAARDRLDFDRMTDRQRGRVTLLQSALTYRDRRLEGFDAAALIEVVEHIEPDRLPAFERIVFGVARPRTIVLTTPNREYNAKFPALADGKLRHRDHRFEWSRAEFTGWATGVAETHGYSVAFSSIGEEDEVLGAPTQMAVFTCV